MTANAKGRESAGSDKKGKTLNNSASMTRADLIKEVQKAQRWLKAAERKSAKEELKSRKMLAGLNNLDLAVRRNEEIRRLEEEITTYKNALEIAGTGDPGTLKLARVVLLPGAANEEDLRLTIDLVLNAETDVWEGNYFAVGYAGSLSASDELYPFVLRGDEIDYGTTGEADPLIKIRGKAVREGATFAFFSDGEARPEGRETYRVTKVVTLLRGQR